jgi:murein DD-endopeptidase MepM/ murein hydrolase activator NlpD/pimeloyl-ACP methyl ester carboxylesterase
MPLVPRRAPAALAALVVLFLAQGLARARPAAAEDAPRYRPPVDAPVVDPFRPPTSPYGPGNRGLDYGTAPGTVVRAAADGRVTFAGVVAGTRHVTVLHDDGLRTTASYLDRIDVVVGQRVHQGDPLGTTTGPLHFSARNGDAYLDPASLFGDGPLHVRLVPFDEPPGQGQRGERNAIVQLLGGIGHALSRGASAAQQTADWLQQSAPDLAATAAHYGLRLVPVAQAVQLAVTTVQTVQAAWDLWRRPCTPSSRPAPDRPGRGHVAVLVGGLGSTSEAAAVEDVDLPALGYAPDDVVRFSYAGGRVPRPDTSAALRAIPTHRYTSDEADGDLMASGRRLADLLEQVVAAAPGQPVDVIGHSQGGLVARLALIELEARHGRAWLEHVGLLATLGTPHGGADLATVADALAATAGGRDVRIGVEQLFGVDADADSVAQMSELSDVVQRLDDHPVPPELHALSVGARGDLVVPLPRTALEGAPEAVVPLDGVHAHDDLPGDARTTRELALALAGAPPTCVGLGAALVDEGAGQAIAQAEDLAGGALWAATTVAEVELPVLPPPPSPEEVHRDLGR